MVENAGDYYHFNTLHEPLMYPAFLRMPIVLLRSYTAGPFLNLGFDLNYTVETDPDRKHLSYLTNTTHVKLFKRFKLPFTDINTRVRSFSTLLCDLALAYV